jgi:hypothetical protein
MPRALAPLALFAASFAAVPQATAQARRLAVVDLAAPPNLAGLAAKLTQDILAAAQKDPSLEVLDPAAVEKVLGADTLTKLKGCIGKPECVASYAGDLFAARLVVGALDRSETSYLIKIFLIDVRGKSVISSIDRAVLIASRRVQADVAAAIPVMLQGQAEARATLAFTSTPKGASITFDGTVVGKTPFAVETKPGKHTVRFFKESYLSVERFVSVDAGAAEKMAITLTPVPGTHPVEDDEQAVAKVETGPTVKLPLPTWIGGGVGIAGGALGALLMTRVKAVEKRAVALTVNGPLEITRVEALSAERQTMFANAAFAVAGIGAATALLFVLVTPGETQTNKPRDQAPPQSPVPAAGIVPLTDGAVIALGGSF